MHGPIGSSWKYVLSKGEGTSNVEAKSQTPSKIHIWGGISMRGATRLIMFKGSINALKYGKIVEAGLVPFIRTIYPDGHQLQQYNDPKHHSNHIKRRLKFHDM